MIKSVNNYPVSQLFDIEAGVVYAIPRYQREYTWSKNHWESLFADLALSEIWSVTQIDARTTKLVDQTMQLFKLEGGVA